MWFENKKDVICIGSASKDIFLPTEEGIVIETPEDITAKQKIAFELGGKYKIADRTEAPGGVAVNVAIGLARLGHASGCYSNVGKDEIGRWLTEELERENVSTGLLHQEKEAKSDLSAILVMTQNGERTIFHNRDANERLVIHPNLLKNTEWLFVSALNGDWRNNFHKILEAKKEYNLLLALNPGQHNIKEDPLFIENALKETDLLLLNKDEAIELIMHLKGDTALSELDDEAYLLRELRTAGAKTIALTDGKRGAWGYDGIEFWYCPIHTRTKVVDTTGAGDAFGSGFFAAQLHGLSLSDSLKYGMANSGSVVGFYGATDGLLRKDEMETIISQITPEKREMRSS